MSEFAPRRYQQVLSYGSGWLTVIAWQSANASGGFIVGTLIQALLVYRNPGFEAPRWQGFLLVVPVMIVCIVVNVWFSQWLPAFQNLALAVHILGAIAVAVVLGILAPHVDATTALLTFTNSGGWPTTGLALMIGQVTSIATLGGMSCCGFLQEGSC